MEQEKCRTLFESVQNKENWKLPTRPVRVKTKVEANVLLEAICCFVGGAEMEKDGQGYIVTSKGYYHYIGA